GRVEARGAFNAPIGDQFALRIAAQHQSSDGYYSNGASFGPITPFGPSPLEGAEGQGDGSDLGGEDVFNLRAKLLWAPTESFRATFQYEFIQDESDTVPAINETPIGDPSFSFNLLGFQQDPGDPLDNAGVTSSDAIGVDIGLGDGHLVDVDGYYLNVEWEVNDSLTLRSITGQRNQDSELANNYVGEVGPISQFDANRADRRETFQQEVRANWVVNDALDLVGGVFYQTNDTTFCVTQTLGFLDLFGLTLPFGTFNENPQVLCNAQDATAWAVYGDATFAMNDRLTLAGGVRYTSEDKDWIGRNQVFYQTLDGGFDTSLSFESLGPLGAADFERFSTGVLSSSASFEEPSWRAVASYEFTDDVFGYFGASRSFRSGAFNDQSGTTGNELTPEGIAATDPETVTSYEVGLRTDFFGDSLRFNPTFFYAKYKDAQRQIAATLTNSQGVDFQETRFFNAAELDILGIEMEAQWITPIDGLLIGGNFSWQDGEFNRFEADTDFDGDIDVDFSGRPLTRTPDTTWTLFGRYEQPVASNLMLRLGATASFEDDQVFNYSDLGSQFDTTLNSRTLVSVTAEVGDAGDAWFIRGFGRNLSDERYRTASQPVADLWVFSQYGEPRTFGVEVGARR
ncbi:MAG: TonB-dependent receptor, partial [Caulobacterales bacterium]|nr:TonB-dependent receptor [Caulobacterales bacterium]